MTDCWDFYALRVDGEPASIFVDLGLESTAPIASLPYMAYVRLSMRRPRPDGLSSQEEFDDLVGIEDSLSAVLCSDDVAYVGRNTSGGYRDFYFYVSRPEGWQEAVAAALSGFDGYEHEAGCREDALWSTYRNFLLPGDLDRHRIENRRTCDLLEEHGDNPSVLRDIDHWSCFPTQEAMDSYIAQTAASGFQVRATSREGQGERPFMVQVWRRDVPTYDNICDVTLPLFEASARLGGTYDGWECAVEA